MGKHGDNEKGGYKFRYKKVIVILFIFVLGIIIYTSIFNSDIGNINITGDFLRSEGNSNESSEVKANLSMDFLELDGVFDRVVFTSVSQVDVEMGKANFKTKNNSRIILENYDGEIILTPEKIIEIDGDADRIETEGGSYEDETDIVIEDLGYKSLKIESVYIKKFEKIVSGMVDVGGTYSDIKNKTLFIGKFNGNLNAGGLNNTIDFSGTAEKVKIGQGDFSWSF